MADDGESSVPSAGPKAIGSLVKKPSDVTRQGTQKLKFVPTLPARRKKEEVKQEAPQSSVQPSDKGNGRGRGRGRGRGGEGRGSAPRPPPAEMTASGPFAMGPTLAGTSARRSTPRSNFTPIVPQGSTKGSVLGANLSNLAAPTLKKDKQHDNLLVDTTQRPKNENDEEVYSEPDEGVEIVDMENVRQLDWMAPETLQRERRDRRKRKGVKPEMEELSLPSASDRRGNLPPSLSLDYIKVHGFVEPSAGNLRDVDRSNALNLSESEEEEELEDLVEDFVIQTNMVEDGTRQERLYFFQFPEPFPTFVSTSAPTPESSREMDVNTSDQGPSTLKRKVSFAADTKPPASASEPTIPATQVGSEASKETPKVDGVIGHIEVYRSGTVKMRLGNGIVLNVSEATQPSFLQQAVHLDMENKQLHVLGEVNKRFVVSPDLDALLTSMELADTNTAVFDDANLIKIDSV
ncbi:RNA polymerase III RPC4-domain-containing protein [Lanmaoa asiatica]|nr:RNA polymerase III RPC4-domain-containing protein [Lanmaoa asiatica]